jgi:hypothetical protein
MKKEIEPPFSRSLAASTLAPGVAIKLSPTCVETRDEVFTTTLTLSGSGSTTTTKPALEVVFALDSSRSMAACDPAGTCKKACQTFVDELRAGDKGGVVCWNGNIDFVEGLTDNFVFLQHRLAAVGNSGEGTNMDVGLSHAVKILDASTNPKARKAIIMLTDGRGTLSSCYNPSSPLAEAARKDYKTYVVAVGRDANTNALLHMASCTGGRYTGANTVEDMCSVFRTLFDERTDNSVPYNIDVEMIAVPGVTVKTTSPAATVTSLDGGRTKILWSNIGNSAAAGLPEGKTVTLSFQAVHNALGPPKPLIDDAARVLYTDKLGLTPYTVNVPQITHGKCGVVPSGDCQEEDPCDCDENKCTHLRLPGRRMKGTVRGKCEDRCIWEMWVRPMKKIGWECGSC